MAPACLPGARLGTGASPPGLFRLPGGSHLGRGRMSSMKSDRLLWTHGWVSLGIGLTGLTFPKGLCRVLGCLEAPHRAGAGLWTPEDRQRVGAAPAATSAGMGLGPRRGGCHRPHAPGGDLPAPAREQGLAGGYYRCGRRGDARGPVHRRGTWRSPRLHAGTVTPSLGMEEGDNAPLESWRGSGLAEDVGASPHRGEEGLPDDVKQRMVREAERELGLPERG